MPPVSRGRSPKKSGQGKKRPRRPVGSGWVNPADLGLSGLTLGEPSSALDRLFGRRDLKRPVTRSPDAAFSRAASRGSDAAARYAALLRHALILPCRLPRRNATARYVSAETPRAIA